MKTDPADQADLQASLDRRWIKYLRCHDALDRHFHEMEQGAAATYAAGLEIQIMQGEQLYLAQYPTFAAYLDQEWDRSTTWANHLVKLTRIYSKEEVTGSPLYPSQLILLAASELEDSVRMAIQEMLIKLEVGKQGTEEAITAAKAAKRAGRSVAEQKRAAKERLDKARQLKEARKKARKERAGRAQVQWIEEEPEGLSWEEHKLYVDVRDGMKELYPKTQGWLKKLGEVTQVLKVSPAQFVGARPMGLWEMLGGLYGQMPEILVEYLAHLPAADRGKAWEQVKEDPAVRRALVERTERLEQERQAREAAEAEWQKERAEAEAREAEVQEPAECQPGLASGPEAASPVVAAPQPGLAPEPEAAPSVGQDQPGLASQPGLPPEPGLLSVIVPPLRQQVDARATDPESVSKVDTEIVKIDQSTLKISPKIAVT